MNCREGDLAVYVGEDMSCQGRIVQCIAIDPLGTQILGTPVWTVEPPLPMTGCDEPSLGVTDIALRPIRDNDGEDETLQWAGKPEGVTA
jgi:hypothetical protein